MRRRRLLNPVSTDYIGVLRADVRNPSRAKIIFCENLALIIIVVVVARVIVVMVAVWSKEANSLIKSK